MKSPLHERPLITERTWYCALASSVAGKVGREDMTDQVEPDNPAGNALHWFQVPSNFSNRDQSAARTLEDSLRPAAPGHDRRPRRGRTNRSVDRRPDRDGDRPLQIHQWPRRFGAPAQAARARRCGPGRHRDRGCGTIRSSPCGGSPGRAGAHRARSPRAPAAGRPRPDG